MKKTKEKKEERPKEMRGEGCMKVKKMGESKKETRKRKGRMERRKEGRKNHQFSGSLTAQGFSIELICKK